MNTFFISVLGLRDWVLDTNRPDARPWSFGRTAFVLNLETGAVERVGCARWSDDGVLAIAALAPHFRTLAPDERKLILADFVRLRAALDANGFWPLPHPTRLSMAGHVVDLLEAARRDELQLVPTRGLRGRADHAKVEFSRVDDRALIHARVIEKNFEKRADVYDFLARPRMLDAATFQAAPLAFEYGSTNDTYSAIAARHDVSVDRVNRDFDRVYGVATGKILPGRDAIYHWVPPVKTLSEPGSAHMPRPGEAALFESEIMKIKDTILSPEELERIMFVDQFGKTAPLADRLAHPASAPVVAMLEKVLDVNEKFSAPPDTEDRLWESLNEFIGGAGDDAAFAGLIEDLREVLPDGPARPQVDVPAWCRAAGITLDEFADIAELRPGVAENVEHSAAAEKRVRMIVDACEAIWGGAPPCETLREDAGGKLVKWRSTAFQIFLDGLAHNRRAALWKLRREALRVLWTMVGMPVYADNNVRLLLHDENEDPDRDFFAPR